MRRVAVVASTCAEFEDCLRTVADHPWDVQVSWLAGEARSPTTHYTLVDNRRRCQAQKWDEALFTGAWLLLPDALEIYDLLQPETVA
jgi:hypothetical protein